METTSPEALNKKAVIRHLISFLEEELSEISGDPTESEAERRRELESLLVMYRFLPSREYAPHEPIIPSSLVTLQTGSAKTIALIVPRGGGLITTLSGLPLQVLTPQSPLGEALLGRKVGDRVPLEVRGQTREYVIVAAV